MMDEPELSRNIPADRETPIIPILEQVEHAMMHTGRYVSLLRAAYSQLEQHLGLIKDGKSLMAIESRFDELNIELRWRDDEIVKLKATLKEKKREIKTLKTAIIDNATNPEKELVDG